MFTQILKYIFIVLLSFFIFGCTSKVNIKVLNPSSLSDSSVKKIIIRPFKNDSVNLKNKIENKMNNLKYSNKNYFQIINTQNRDILLKEQKILDSGIVELENSETVFSLPEAKSILFGKITNKNHKRTIYYKTRVDYSKCIKYKNDKCKKYFEYKVRCIEKSYNLESNFSILRINDNKTIYSKSIESSKKIYQCLDRKKINDDKNKIFSALANNITDKFLYDIAPVYSNIRVIILEDEYISYSKREKQVLKDSIRLLKKSFYNESIIKLQILNELTKHNSYVAFYNLAIANEAIYNLELAKKYYFKARELTLNNDSNEVVLKAAKRIINRIALQKLAKKQLNN